MLFYIFGLWKKLLRNVTHYFQVDIHFEETFYNAKDESYRVLCVGELFNREPLYGMTKN